MKKKRGSVEIKTFAMSEGNAPSDYDLLVDCTSLPNPHKVSTLRDLDGTKPEVQDYVMKDKRAKELIRKLIPRCVFHPYENQRFVVMIGCYGGKHRSVAIAEELKSQLSELKVNAWVSHTARWRWKRKDETHRREKLKA